MLVYRKGFLGICLLFQIEGSALPRALLPALVMTSIGVLCTALFSDELQRRSSDPLEEGWLLHPYPASIFVFLLGFLLVFRTNLSYARYMEARTHVASMNSKWSDAYAFAIAFSMSPAHTRGEAESMAHRDEFARELMYKLSLLHGLALLLLRDDHDLRNLVLVNASAPLADNVSEQHSAARDSGCWCRWSWVARSLGFSYYSYRAISQTKLPILAPSSSCGVDTKDAIGHAQHDALIHTLSSAHPPVRTSHAMTDLLVLLERARARDLLSKSAPTDTRIVQVLSDGYLGFNQALKISTTPFPFAYAQLSVALLVVFTGFIPVLLASLVLDTTLLAILCFISGLFYWAIHEVAREVEDPFRYAPNHLPLEEQQDFNRRLMSSYTFLSAHAEGT